MKKRGGVGYRPHFAPVVDAADGAERECVERVEARRCSGRESLRCAAVGWVSRVEQHGGKGGGLTRSIRSGRWLCSRLR